ncbi:hypothetical protein O4J56_06250 [Nocardiopsis sp. RSe5-2]|uniref:Rpn family recombination-promoting nuclease/putative transposase n=1 Tax=Nocardiopsis endophytica TaxID=3018445 RepID=A0ABT4TZW8_9ACTN|nr:hypothetical protein [Nocardiopsis endophytica]MDA2810235.1 hypothetical protein [Nocardiopsis endophytica]
MVKPPHEALHRIFCEDPHLLGRTFEHLFGNGPPAPDAVSVLNTDLSEIKVIERRADSVLWLEYGAEGHILIIESQSEKDGDKRGSWPYYVSYLYEKFGCGVTLLVACPSRATASWARDPIVIGSPWHATQMTTPIVLGPDNVETVTDPERAAGDVMLAVFSALVHRKGPDRDGILKALAEALDTIEVATAKYIAEFTETGLDEGPAREFWRELMAGATYHYPSQMRLQGREEGRVEGRVEMAAHAVLTVLEGRRIPVSDAARRRVLACTDQDVLEVLLRRAGVVASADELLDDLPEDRPSAE